MDIINAIESLTITKTGNSKMVKQTGDLGATSRGYAREYKVEYPGGSFTGTNYEIQDFFIKNPQLVPEGQAARKKAQTIYNKTWNEAKEKHSKIIAEKPEEDYFYTYYKDKLTPQVVASLEKEGVKTTQGFETILNNYFQRGELDRIGKDRAVNKEIANDKKAGEN